MEVYLLFTECSFGLACIMSKKDCILSTTLSLIKDHGFHGTSMSMIANKAGAATGTIYHYYQSKDDLIKDLFRKVNTDLKNALHFSLNSVSSYEQQFSNFWLNEYTYFVENPEALMFLEQYTSSPYYTKEEQAYTDDLFKEIKQFFENGIENQAIKNLNKEVLSPVVRGSIIATARLQISGKNEFTKEQLNNIISLVWNAIKNK